MKIKNKLGSLLISGALSCFVSSAVAQDTTTQAAASPAELVKSTFENGVLINNQTVDMPSKKSVDAIISHRFGSIVTADKTDPTKQVLDISNLLGLYSPSNIRLGVNYGITDNIMLGVGATKNKHIYDAQWKYRILQQKTKGMPVSVTYYGDAALSTLPQENFINGPDSTYKFTSRLTYFHELMIGWKFNTHLSLQGGFSYTHINYLDTSKNYQGIDHDSWAFSFVGRYKFSPQSSVLVEFNQPLLVNDNGAKGKNPKPNLGIGWEVSTGNHQFQIFLCTADAIVNQEMNVYNTNDFTKKQMVIGFNLTREWGF